MPPSHTLGAHRLALGAALWLALEAGALDARAAPPPVRVTIQDQPRFDAARSTRLQGGGFEVRAQLEDDTNAPIVAAAVTVGAPGADGAELQSCAPGRSSRIRRGTALQTDDAGALCVRVTNVAPGTEIALAFAGDSLHLPAAARLALEAEPSELELAFESPSLELELEHPTQRLRLRIAGTPEREPIPAIELELQERGRSQKLAASEWSRSGNLLSFSIDTAELGAPGPARLIARRVGGERLVRAETVALKVATVQLGAEPVSPSEPGAALELQAWAQPRGALSPSGWVEATRGETGSSLGSAPLEAGSAILRIDAPDASGEVWLHYRADDPWWRAGTPLELQLGDPGHPRGPRRWPWLALLVPIGYVCMRSLQRPAPRQGAKRAPVATSLPAPLVLEAAAPLSGWVGSVFDAHDGHPIAGARVQARFPSFREADVATHTATTDGEGRFRLPALPEPLPEGARLTVWAVLHSDIDRPLPPQGRVSITLTSRRRAVLRRLVRWARSLGSPWLRVGEPTPGDVASLARRRGDAQTARWAEEVEAAAFGSAPVDEAREMALRQAEPAWRQGAAERDGQDD